MNFKIIPIIISLLFSINTISAQHIWPENRYSAIERYMASMQKKLQERDSIKIYWARDKGQHVVAGLYGTALIGQVAFRFTETSKGDARLIAVGTMLSIGMLKELYDSSKKDNRFSWKDMTANMMGIVLGFILLGIN